MQELNEAIKVQTPSEKDMNSPISRLSFRVTELQRRSRCVGWLYVKCKVYPLTLLLSVKRYATTYLSRTIQ
jgi:hypothetical protein